jgi:hypothetical protein
MQDFVAGGNDGEDFDFVLFAVTFDFRLVISSFAHRGWFIGDLFDTMGRKWMSTDCLMNVMEWTSSSNTRRRASG